MVASHHWAHRCHEWRCVQGRPGSCLYPSLKLISRSNVTYIAYDFFLSDPRDNPSDPRDNPTIRMLRSVPIKSPVVRNRCCGDSISLPPRIQGIGFGGWRKWCRALALDLGRVQMPPRPYTASHWRLCNARPAPDPDSSGRLLPTPARATCGALRPPTSTRTKTIVPILS